MPYRRQSHSYSAWTIPLLYGAFAIAVGTILPRLELHVGMISSPVSSAAAIGIYSSIASGMIALTGIVFSLAFLVVQFSATAYSPRLVLWKARDPFLSHALGVFVGTFLYSLTALAWVDRLTTSGVPLLSFACAALWLLASVGMFIGLIGTVGALQIGEMLQFINRRGRFAIESLYPDTASASRTSKRLASPSFAKRSPDQTLIYSAAPQALQSIDVSRLVSLAIDSGGCILVLVSVGDSLSKSTSLLSVFDSLAPISSTDLEAAFTIGNERTFEQDPTYPIRLLVDIAIKALSPAINDPTTAVQALDHIEDLLVCLGERHLDYYRFTDTRGIVRVVIPHPEWADFLRLGLDEILQYGSTSVQVLRRMRAVIAKLESTLPIERQEAILYWKKRMDEAIIANFEDPDMRLEASVEDRQGLGVGNRQGESVVAPLIG
jgi:uncharacterized membrane protein